MKNYKLITLLLLLFGISGTTLAQSDADEVKQVLARYKKALESLNVDGTEVLFMKNSQVIESGKVEGTYEDYLAHHIGPELDHFKSFHFENYKVEVTVTGDYAFAVETYNYTIVLKKDNTEIKRTGVASSFLKRDDNDWKIMHMHNSSRKPK